MVFQKHPTPPCILVFSVVISSVFHHLVLYLLANVHVVWHVCMCIATSVLGTKRRASSISIRLGPSPTMQSSP